MAVAVIMPKLGMTMEKGRILHWLKKPGEAVRRGEPLIEIETDKVAMEVEAEVEGILLAITCGEGEEVPVAFAIGWIGAPGERVPSQQPPAAAGRQRRVAATPAARRLAEESGVTLAGIAGSGPHGAVTAADVRRLARQSGAQKASPLARETAARMGVDVGTLHGSGPAGRVMRDDVIAAAAAAAAANAAADRRPLPSMRRAIARRMLASHRDIPAVTLHAEADVTALLASRGHLSVNDFVLSAAARTVREQERFRASLEGDSVVIHPRVHLGFAVALDDGLVVPVIRDADGLGLEALSTAARDLADRARGGALSPDDLAGAVFTVTNLGMYGVTSFDPLIDPPQVAILGVGAACPRFVLQAGQPAERRVLDLALSIDHRLLDGAAGGAFLRRLVSLLERPDELPR